MIGKRFIQKSEIELSIIKILKYLVPFIIHFHQKGDDQVIKGKNSDEVVEKIDNIDIQIDSCLDGLLEKGYFFLNSKF